MTLNLERSARLEAREFYMRVERLYDKWKDGNSLIDAIIFRCVVGR